MSSINMAALQAKLAALKKDAPPAPVEQAPVPTPSYDHPVLAKVAALEAAIESGVPGFKLVLREIHMALASDPACVTLLSEDQIGTIVQGLSITCAVELQSAAAAKATGTRKAKAIISADEL